MEMMIPKKRVSSGNCLRLRRELDSNYKRFRRAQRSRSEAGNRLGIVINIRSRLLNLDVRPSSEAIDHSQHDYQSTPKSSHHQRLQPLKL
jgi:hypothetical protein